MTAICIWLALQLPMAILIGKSMKACAPEDIANE